MGYHLNPITNGTFGEPSKIKEEVDEFLDAIDQGAEVMAIQELSDLVGAIEGWLEIHHPTLCLDDLIMMKDITARAFRDGTRRPRHRP